VKLLLALPVMLPMALLTAPASFERVTPSAWAGLAYVSLFSMLIGFVFWYRGLALGGVAAVSQLQLLQPFFGLGLAALLLNERVSGTMLVATLAAVLCVAGARRFAADRPQVPAGAPSVAPRVHPGEDLSTD
jgi:drug/metabolite transporter (DMT)-like permease